MKKSNENGTPVPLYAELKVKIEEEILSGDFSDGDFFGTIKDLCGKYGISLITARKAVELMVIDGTVTCRSSQGIFISNRQKLLSLYSLKRYVVVISNHSPDGLSTYFSLRLWAMTQALSEKGIGLKLFRREEKEEFDRIFPLESIMAIVPSQPVFKESEISYYSSKLPLLLFHKMKKVKNIISVVHDLEKSAYLACDYLKHKNIKKIIIAGPVACEISSYLDKQGLQYEYLPVEPSAIHGYKAAQKLLNLSDNNAIIASDEYTGLGIVEAFLKAGKDIRDSGRFINIGNPRFSLARELRIPTVGCDPCLVGRLAAEALANAIQPPYKTFGIIKVQPEIYIP